ncbi:hypothetical protein LguiB_006320 [Lonicera macranthoides]
MFYSHTILAKKGPLGTVWCAVHLQHKLKKSHYTSTDISSTVERIMCPDVPIALRMSGHLLLGVVRIYSKKVDYLYKDCNVVLIGLGKAFSTAEVNVPADATHAPFHSVTLPGTFDLDALDLDDDDLYQDGFHDNHLRSQEEITLRDQIPFGRDPYVLITFDKDVLKDLSHEEDASGSGARPMEEDSNPSIAVRISTGFQDPGPSNQTGTVNERPNEDSIPQNIPEVEVMRDAVHDLSLGNVPSWPDQGDDRLEPDRDLEQLIFKEMPTPAVEEISVPGGHSIQSQQNQELPPSASDQGHGIFDSHNSFRDGSPDYVICPSPVEQPKARPRKRKQLFDEATVLTNKFVKEALDNTSNILRAKRNCPCSALGVWKLSNRLKKDKVFFEAIITGPSADLCNIFTEDSISSKPQLVSTGAAQREPSVAPTSDPTNDVDMEYEHIRNYEGPSTSNILPDIVPSSDRFPSSPNAFLPHPSSGGDDFTPAYGTTSEQVPTTTRTRVTPTPDPDASTGPFGSDMETPVNFFDNMGLSDIPEMADSAVGELSFLEDDNTPAGSQGTPEVAYSLRKENGMPEINTLSVRTRAVAQFLIAKSSCAPISDDQLGELSLNNILEGKRRKVSARMFYETLVLKSYGLVDLEQKEPYGDIILKVMPKLSKEQFSS